MLRFAEAACAMRARADAGLISDSATARLIGNSATVVSRSAYIK